MSRVHEAWIRSLCAVRGRGGRPEVERAARVYAGRRDRSCSGSSLGGVVSFYTVWQHPDVFGSACCMSSTFSHRDDLIDRVLRSRSVDVGFYLDSGWPGDNYEVTVGMAMALISRGMEVRPQPDAPVLPDGRAQRDVMGDATAPADAVPERRRGARLSSKEADSWRSPVSRAAGCGGSALIAPVRPLGRDQAEPARVHHLRHLRQAAGPLQVRSGRQSPAPPHRPVTRNLRDQGIVVGRRRSHAVSGRLSSAAAVACAPTQRQRRGSNGLTKGQALHPSPCLADDRLPGRHQRKSRAEASWRLQTNNPQDVG